MILSDLFAKLDIENEVLNEKEFESLGLVKYNSGHKVCTFIEDAKYARDLGADISMVITNKKIAQELIKTKSQFGICIVENPRNGFFKLQNYLAEEKLYNIETFSTKIGRNCNISSLSSIDKNNVIIGDNVTVEEFVVIRENTVIGDNTVIRAGCVIGGQGFEFKKEGDMAFHVAHVGKVIIGDNVEIQYNSCVDKAIYPWDATVISDYTKVDNLVHIAHGVKIGERSNIVANSGIGGRVIIGDDAWIGFGATIRNGLSIGNKARANMGAVVTKSIEDNDAVSGNFAIDHKEFIKNLKKQENL